MLVARPKALRERVGVVCTSGTSISDCVRIAGPPVGDRYSVDTADISGLSGMPAIGICIDKASPTLAMVQLRGEVKGVFTGLTPGKVYFVATSGGITATPPAPTMGSPRIYHQAVGVALSSDVLMLEPDPKMTIRVL